MESSGQYVIPKCAERPLRCQCLGGFLKREHSLRALDSYCRREAYRIADRPKEVGGRQVYPGIRPPPTQFYSDSFLPSAERHGPPRKAQVLVVTFCSRFSKFKILQLFKHSQKNSALPLTVLSSGWDSVVKQAFFLRLCGFNNNRISGSWSLGNPQL